MTVPVAEPRVKALLQTLTPLLDIAPWAWDAVIDFLDSDPPSPASPRQGEPVDVERVHRLLCFALIDHEPGSNAPYLWPCTKFAAEYAALSEPTEAGEPA